MVNIILLIFVFSPISNCVNLVGVNSLHNMNIRNIFKKGNLEIYRSSCWEVFCEKGVLRSFTKFTGKHLCQSLFFNKVADLGLGSRKVYFKSCQTNCNLIKSFQLVLETFTEWLSTLSFHNPGRRMIWYNKLC